MIPLSILDLVPVVRGSTPREALHRSLELAQQAERLGDTRYWAAEQLRSNARQRWRSWSIRLRMAASRAPAVG